ncbi:alpha/beta hydrolase family protein [Advenella mimigardefordensis]|uniref:Alpha/beta hydrolase fold domain-containing protein n=1 Tax=Advenella mimigardefordensis (strain DSM 17166 / LMG 22922 / DPN7) TaxID=1247726 RepID=W0PA38_ADVMD|nr:alpha/beta fold hydrolase [Advenella mimigardefordensis]AHG63689.1 alpha/beta hydrolase fold domain-containing protein [Advenella mimigardefordensis DPN7]
MPQAVQITTADGYRLHANVWQPAQISAHSPVVVINSATSVRSRYYHRFAHALRNRGCTVVTYDYRGIGDSKHGSLRDLPAGWLDWGQTDFEAVLQYVHSHYCSSPLYVAGHSIGGFLIGLAPSAHLIQRIFTMGAQYAYWRDYASGSRTRMFLQWHIAMPLLTKIFGYVPASRLGWMEDTPRGVALDWSGMGPRFEQSLGRRYGAHDKTAAESELPARLQQVTAPILALGVSDDPFGTPAALDRVLDYYSGCERRHLRISPADIGHKEIGHFAFFHSRFSDSLWPLAFDWLLGADTESAPGTIIRYRKPKE